jgi:hypothetical protein
MKRIFIMASLLFQIQFANSSDQYELDPLPLDGKSCSGGESATFICCVVGSAQQYYRDISCESQEVWDALKAKCYDDNKKIKATGGHVVAVVRWGNTPPSREEADEICKSEI